ncbi:hypothetical protein [Agrococcus carbonis]|uniref:Uncharacterized protein n=1 Tax=Agrococcus carbonis TaxID=684552 RepID=A0A1H1L208_9MICO|nr:hypothetical protein [Agrococcus carbonis]SDR68302.1 hypothetical protein SAMN04489719_0358 [Agrococcus carbonis]
MSPFDPTDLLAGPAGFGFAVLLIWLGLCVLGILATYWLIRLAVRHGTKDAMLWQARGMPTKAEKRYRVSLALQEQRRSDLGR